MEYVHGGDLFSAQAGYGGAVLDFSTNLNPLGMPPAVGRAAAAAHFAPYPDPLCRHLRRAIAAHDGVWEEQILCGNGAADLIFRLAFALRPRRALVTAPTFSEYEGALACVDCQVERYALDGARDFDLDEEILEAITPGMELVFLCTPNNPTGRLVPQKLLLAAAERCQRVGAVLAVDECFLPLADGGGNGLAPYLTKFPKLFLLRAFTKSYAMAGLRLGYGLSADPDLLERLSRFAQPWSVSAPAQAAGMAAFTLCPSWPEQARTLVARERPLLAAELTDLGCAVAPSQANYLLFRVEKVTDLKERLIRKGVLIRACGNYQNLGPDWYRVCVRSGEENRRLLTALKEVL
ncbi:threonine-phosphate decarboxylase CobD [Pseudoflavonifractor phocaeensis]|uniref:threonine-phosphate decarboxylase CobD n=1 Tax=Pseudoflavonifractor phocaeensis TaxID=1870988 RepID=UPI001956B159|nr:threonine-phosphate decarboxylase CobD [Pseudoflavonifractor phocaeensis]MBM6925431.1 threonine-phosphate decarboxylase [Pseudoflavonifractor phocaeensis]